MTRPLNQLMRVAYPNGVVAYAPVFPDGTYYGRTDVEAGHAVAVVSTDCPLDRYHEWLAHSSTAILEGIEAQFSRLVELLSTPNDHSLVLSILEILSTSEVYTHFRIFWEGPR